MIREEIPQRSRTVSTAEKIVLPAFEVQEGPFPIAPPPVKAPSGAYAQGEQTIAKTKEPTADMATLLASTPGLRGAMILREILGPPRGLRMQMECSDGI
jgi:hypothetical protein